jgi:pyruvate,water dikinase
MLHRVENLFGWPPDTEWTGRGERFTLLQARPITTLKAESDDGRSWYLSLRPKMGRLTALAHRVTEELIPELEETGGRFAAEQIESYDDQELADVIEARHSAVERWREIYYEEFIPFAHGVRQLGTYYNDAVRPEDPYEFVGLLSGEPMLATRRNQKLHAVAERVRTSPALQQALHQALSVQEKQAKDWPWRQIIQNPQTGSEADQFVQDVEGLLADSLDVAYAGERLADRPDLLLQTILQLADASQDERLALAKRGSGAPSTRAEETIATLEARLLEAVGEERREEAQNVMAIARLSWRLRDDDNLLVGRLESQLLRALDLAVTRLVAAGRLPEGTRAGIPASSTLAGALRARDAGPIDLPEAPIEASERQSAQAGERPRQLVGQPAAPGLASGSVRSVREAGDLGQFRAGEVLVCDAIQPTMTHLVPLASAIVERRGGMLIHGAIIARELGIPCVNGIADAVDLLPNGELVTVDGYLGIVTVGPPEFGLESAMPPDEQSGTDSVAEGA